jgi:hypothetical protein
MILDSAKAGSGANESRIKNQESRIKNQEWDSYAAMASSAGSSASDRT